MSIGEKNKPAQFGRKRAPRALPAALRCFVFVQMNKTSSVYICKPSE